MTFTDESYPTDCARSSRPSLGAIAAVRGGVLLTADARAHGWDKAALHRLLARDGWQCIHRGAWAEHGCEIDPPLRLRATVLAHPVLTVSHRSAAWLHDIELVAEAYDFTAPRHVKPTLHGGRLIRAPLGSEDVTVVQGLPVTTVTRTLADLLRVGPRDEALVAVESALTRRPSGRSPGTRRPPLTTVEAIRAALNRSPRIRWTGTARVSLALASPLSGSPPESLLRLRFHDAGLYPAQQARLRAPDGRTVIPDFLFLAEGLAVEVEGYEYHGGRTAHARDLARFNALAGTPGIRRILRFSARDVRARPEAVVRVVQAALAAR